MRVEELMTRRVATVEMDDTLEKILELFENIKFHHLLVVEDGRLVGVVSDRDVLKALSPFVGSVSERTQDLMTLRKRAHQIMSRDLITARPETPLRDACKIFVERGISCLPVTDEEMTVRGILTWRDVLKFARCLC